MGLVSEVSLFFNSEKKNEISNWISNESELYFFFPFLNVTMFVDF